MSDGVKWSDIDAKAKPYRDGFVQTFREYAGKFLLNEKSGEPLRDRQGRRLKVTQRSFAARYGIAERTFRDWVRGGKSADIADQPSKPVSQKSSKPRKKKAEGEGSDEKLPNFMTRSSADELAADVRHSLNQIDPSKLTNLGWKYLDQAQEKLSSIYDEAQAKAR